MDNLPYEDFKTQTPQECAEMFISKASWAYYSAVLVLAGFFVPQLALFALLGASFFNLNVKKLDMYFQCAIGAGGSFTQEYYDSEYVYVSNYLEGELAYHSWIVNIPFIGAYLRLFSIYNMMNQLNVLSSMM